MGASDIDEDKEFILLSSSIKQTVLSQKSGILFFNCQKCNVRLKLKYSICLPIEKIKEVKCIACKEIAGSFFITTMKHIVLSDEL